MKKIFASLVVIAMIAITFHHVLVPYDGNDNSETDREVLVRSEPESDGEPVPVTEDNGYPELGITTEDVLLPDGSIDPVMFQKWKEGVQRENDRKSNLPPKGDSRFPLTTATGIAFLFPNEWPRVMYLENYSVVGVLYEDSNGNGIWNTGEIGVPNAPVHTYWGPGTTREIMPPPVTSAAGNSLGVFSTYFIVSENTEGNYRLNFSFRGLTTPNGTAFYEHTPGSPPPAGQWLAREPSTWPPNPLVDFEAQIWHEVRVDFQITSPDIDNIEVDDTLEIMGTLEDRDLGSGLDQKILHMKFDNNPVYPTTVTTSSTGTFSYQYRIPETIRAGKHKFTVEFQSTYIDAETHIRPNFFFNDNSTTIEFKVHRKTHFEVEDKTVYRTDTINITGSIVDNMGEGPDTTIANETFQYEVVVNWGTPSDLYYEPGLVCIPFPSGNFSRQFTIKKTQPLTRVKVTFQFRVKNAEHGATMFYKTSSEEAHYTVKARTIIELQIMDKNGKEELDTVARTGSTSSFKIKGVLWDKDLKDSSGHWTSPIEKMSIQVWWGNKRLYRDEKQKTDPTTDQFGRFSVDHSLGIEDPIGPVVVRAMMEDTWWYKGFDTDSYSGDGSYFGKVVDVVAKSTVEITGGSGIKGDNPVIKGRLYDDRGWKYGIGNRSVELYWKKTKFAPLGSTIGVTSTDHTGNFVFNGFQIPKTQSVGEAYVVGIFRGSPKVIHPKDNQKHFTAGDAYDYTESDDVKFNISSYITVTIDPSILNGSRYTRGDTIKISGEVVEIFEGVRSSPPRYVKGVQVSAYLDWINSEKSQKLPDITTDDFGQYEIVATVPKSLTVGEYILRMYFNDTEKYCTKPEYLESRSIVIVADTYIKMIEGQRPEDVTGDGIPDIGYVKGAYESGFRYGMLLLEENTLLNEQVPVPNGTVTLTITLWDDKGGRYINTTTGKTDIRGRVDFNFTEFMSNEGVSIDEPGLGASGKVLFEFKGSDYLTKTNIEEELTYIGRPVPPDEGDWWLQPAFLIGAGIFLLILIIVMVVLILYLRRRARIMGIKRIIKRAADQLVAGNEYTAVIFKSYQKLGMHLRKHGYLRREAETFREFESAVRQALPVDKSSLDGFLTILEEARYSSHEIGETQRNNAITNLRGIESSLAYIQLDEEEALRKLEESEADFVETEIVMKK